MTILSVQELVHSYGDRQVLNGLSFSLEGGEVFGLLGPNGSGKSTVFSIIAGLRELQGGTITFDGRTVSGADRQMRASMGVVFQSPSLDGKLSCRDNLELAARLYGITGDLAVSRITKLLAIADLESRADDIVGELSGGMRRRLDLARALISEPRLLLMDEPTSGLDEAAFRSTWEHLDEMRAGRELTILVTTHRPEEAERCDRIAIISNGAVAATDTPVQLRAQVANDVIVLQGPDTEGLLHVVADNFDAVCRANGNQVIVECEGGHALIPRIVELLPKGTLDSVSLRHPSLADVFLKITGTGLEVDV